MTGALLCMGYAASLAETVHRRARAGTPVASIAIDHTVRMAAAGVALFLIFRIGR